MANRNKFGEIGDTGLAIWSGQVLEDFTKELRGKEGFKRYREMVLSSPIVGALLMAIELSIRSVTWQFVSEEGENDPRLEFLDAALNNMSHAWDDHITEALTMLPYGWSFFEIVYRYGGERETDPAILNGKVMWRKLAIRGQDTLERWQLDENGGLEGMWQAVTAPKYQRVFIPIEKAILYRTRIEKGNPEGRSILRSAWIPYYYEKNISQIEAIGIERDLAGLPMIELPETADTTENEASDQGKAEKIVRRVRNDEQAGIVIPAGWKFSLLSTGGSRQFDTDKVVNRYDSRILMSTLAQFLLLGQEGVGSLALSKDQTDLFTMAVNATADILGSTFSQYAVPRLLKLNGWPAMGIQLEHSPAGDVDIAAVADFLSKVDNKITWTASDEAWLRAAAKLPEVDKEEIEAEREEKRSLARALAQKIPTNPPSFEKGNGATSSSHSPKEEEMIAEVYAAGGPPDDYERRKWENRLQRLMADFLADEKERVMKAAKQMRKGS